jgi:ketosteroid isomerase-like protein
MSRIARSLLAVLACGMAFTVSAHGNSLTAEQHAALEASIAVFRKATEANDAMAVVGFMPPEMIAKLAAKAQSSEDAFRKVLADRLAKLAERVNKAEFALDMTKADEGTAADGTAYAIVPAKLKIELKGGINVKTGAKTFAFEQGGHWYLLALTDDNIKQQFYDAYPQFKGVDISLSRLSQGN